MSDLSLILDTINEWSEHGTNFALATVVGVRGSTYRGLGARQLVAADGTSIGTVSGGCLDADLQAVAAGVIARGVPQLVEFDLTADDEAIWGWGIGCNGATELLVEPAAHARVLADQLRGHIANQRPVAIIHHLEPLLPAEFVTDSAGDEIAAAMSAGEHAVITRPDERRFIEVIGAPPRLLVCGAGHDAVPLVRYAAELGFDVVVADDRRQFLTSERFGHLTALVHCRPTDLTRHVEVDRRTYAVIMSHNYLRDLDYLRDLLGSKAAYIGCLGPGARLTRLLDDLAGEGVQPPEPDRLHGPAGLDVGADGPEEIAWAVMAEILAVRRGTSAGFLRDRKGPARSTLAGFPKEGV